MASTPKMNNYSSLHELFAMYRRDLGYSIVACIVALVRHWQARDPFRETFTNGILVAVVAFGMRTILDYFGIESDTWGYLASVLLGYVGVGALFDVIASRIPFLKSATSRGGNDVQPK